MPLIILLLPELAERFPFLSLFVFCLFRYFCKTKKCLYKNKEVFLCNFFNLILNFLKFNLNVINSHEKLVKIIVTFYVISVCLRDW